MNASKPFAAGCALIFGFTGCASILDFDAPFEQAGGASSTSTTAHGGSGGSGTTSTSSTTSSSAACVPKSSCTDVGFTCGTFFNGCEDEDCGTCMVPYVCDGSHVCGCPGAVTVHPTLVADTTIQNHASWQCGALTSGAFPCINVSQYLSDSRALLRFSIDAATQKAIVTPGSVMTAKLTLRATPTCAGSSFTNAGKVQVFVLRNDWDEDQARWCHRSGPQDSPTVNPWSTPGANDATLDHGPLAAEVDIPPGNMPFDVDLDPAKLVSPLVTGTAVSLLVVTPPGSVLVIQTKEGGAPATLDIDYCPAP